MSDSYRLSNPHISPTMIEDPWPSRSHRRSTAGLFDDTTETICYTFPPYSPEAAQQVLGHELHHYAMIASTPYGAFIAGLNDRRYEHFWKFLHEIAATGAGIRFPWSEWIPKLYSEAAIPASTLASFLSFNSITRLLKILEGVRNISLDDLQLFLDSLQAGKEESMRYFGNPKIVHLNPPANENLDAYGPGFACPVFNGVAIGGMHLVEASAWFYEYIQVGDIGEIIDVGLPEELYKTAFTLFFEKTRHIFAVSDDLPKNPDLVFEYVDLAVTFFCAVQLALQAPLNFPVMEAVGTPQSWFDLHPGWRFVRICEALASMEAKADKDLTNYRELQNQVCRRLQWPVPGKFAEIVTGILSKSAGDMDLSFRRMADLLTISDDYPWAYIFPVSKYPYAKSPPPAVPARLVHNYPPTLMSHDFITSAGIKFSTDGDNRYNAFVSYYSRDVQNRLRGNQQLREFVRAHYLICRYVTTAFADWLMFNEEADIRSFVEASFPRSFQITKAMPFLLRLLDIGFTILCGVSVSELKHVKGQALTLPAGVEDIQLDRYLTQSPFGVSMPEQIPFIVLKRGQ